MRWPLHFRLNVTGSGHRAPFCTEEQPGSGWPPVSRLVQNVSAVRRDKYEMNISPSHVRFGLWYQNTNPMDGRPGDCNPGSDGAGQICVNNVCVAGCNANWECPGSTTCVSGTCQ